MTGALLFFLSFLLGTPTLLFYAGVFLGTVSFEKLPRPWILLSPKAR